MFFENWNTTSTAMSPCSSNASSQLHIWNDTNLTNSQLNGNRILLEYHAGTKSTKNTCPTEKKYPPSVHIYCTFPNIWIFVLFKVNRVNPVGCSVYPEQIALEQCDQGLYCLPIILLNVRHILTPKRKVLLKHLNVFS